jgi:two-component system sensor histidine kinase/response regulator
VGDSGIGIPADKLETIFEEFTQADASVTRTHGGTGLGLTICRRIVEQMGGELQVASEVGRGSEFWFTVPLPAVAEEVTVDRRRPPLVELEGRRFLVVDDSETARRIVREALESVGAGADEADGVDSALKLLGRAARAGALYDAAIIDRMMPERDGFELAAAVQARSDLAGLRILMLTSAQEVEGRKKARERGIGGYLTKPVGRADLLDAVQALLGLHGPGKGPEGRLITAATLLKDRPQAKVLLAEDNRVNQQIVVVMLTKRGHQVDVVEDGRAAVESVKDGDYDVVLMDIQMPEMDGLTATRRIRSMKSFRDLPIVALTASALAEERERCEAAGMNDFVAKPFKPQELLEAVERSVRPGGRPEPLGGEEATDTEVRGPEPERPVNIHEFRTTMREAGIEEVVPTMLSTYLDESPGKMEAMVEAVAARDGDRIAKAAHALKSASGTIRAEKLAELLQRLEHAGAKGEIGQAVELIGPAQQEFGLVAAYLREEVAR